MTQQRRCDVFFFPEMTMFVPSCIGLDGRPYMAQAGGVKKIASDVAMSVFSAALYEAWLFSGLACPKIKSWKDVDLSWMKESGRKSRKAFVQESIGAAMSNKNFPGQISVSIMLPDLRQKFHLGTTQTPRTIIPDSIEPTAIGKVVLKLLGEGKKIIDEGKWDPDKGRMCE